MQELSLNLVQILQHAARFHGQVEIVSRLVEDDSIHRYTYADALRRTTQLAAALKKLGVQTGDRVGTLAWNTHRHVEAWYAVSGQGAICHTINPRLFEKQIEYIVNHAQDKIVLADVTFVPMLQRLQDSLPTIEHVIVMTDEANIPPNKLRSCVAYETLLADSCDEFDWPNLPEETPSSLCYTSGTTGDPKGVLYTHRSTILHAYANNGKDANGIARGDTMLMGVPMFHANGWGFAYSCPMVGAKMVLPGAKLDGASMYQLLNSQRVTVAAGVPTVWNMLLTHVDNESLTLTHLEEAFVGGSAVPRSMAETLEGRHDVTVVHGWGMTESSPVAAICRRKPFMKSLPQAEQLGTLVKQGTPLFGVFMKIVDDDGCELPHDGRAQGRLLIKGPWIVQRYYRADRDAVDSHGWLDTGDIATIDEHGYMQVTDRAKDLIKSGGEWISSLELENATNDHPQVAMAAAIAMPDPKWGERPRLVVQLTDRADLTEQQLLEFLEQKVARWWLPDKIHFVEAIPQTATGKIDKRHCEGNIQRFKTQPANHAPMSIP